MTGETDSVTVYVRKGVEKHERLVTFIPPTVFSQLELMDDGWAIDGNQMLRSVPINQLNRVQRQMIDSFRQKGFEIQFC